MLKHTLFSKVKQVSAECTRFANGVCNDCFMEGRLTYDHSMEAQSQGTVDSRYARHSEQHQFICIACEQAAETEYRNRVDLKFDAVE
jgi:hypothetical protein